MMALKKLLATSNEVSTLSLSIARIALGLFFFASGFNKLFVLENQQLMLETLIYAGIPLAQFMAVFVAACECFGGLMLALGLLTRVNALLLFIISLVALLTVGIHTLPTTNWLTWYSWFFYLPEPLYMLLCVMLMCHGGVMLSLDHWLVIKRLRKRRIVFIR